MDINYHSRVEDVNKPGLDDSENDCRRFTSPTGCKYVKANLSASMMASSDAARANNAGVTRVNHTGAMMAKVVIQSTDSDNSDSPTHSSNEASTDSDDHDDSPPSNVGRKTSKTDLLQLERAITIIQNHENFIRRLIPSFKSFLHCSIFAQFSPEVKDRFVLHCAVEVSLLQRLLIRDDQGNRASMEDIFPWESFDLLCRHAATGADCLRAWNNVLDMADHIYLTLPEVHLLTSLAITSNANLISDKDVKQEEADRLEDIERDCARSLELELEDGNLLAELVQLICAIKAFQNSLWSALENLRLRFDWQMAPDISALLNSR